MPKDKVYDQSELFDVEVGWSPNHDVQIGLVTHSGVSIAEWLASAVVASGGDMAQLPTFDSLWASLDRAGINRLIRTLRRARDSAYGSDE